MGPLIDQWVSLKSTIFDDFVDFVDFMDRRKLFCRITLKKPRKLNGRITLFWGPWAAKKELQWNLGRINGNFGKIDKICTTCRWEDGEFFWNLSVQGENCGWAGLNTGFSWGMFSWDMVWFPLGNQFFLLQSCFWASKMQSKRWNISFQTCSLKKSILHARWNA